MLAIGGGMVLFHSAEIKMVASKIEIKIGLDKTFIIGG
jgi:hypothetical protein